MSQRLSPLATEMRDRGVALLVHYFEAIAKKAGMAWDADYTVEIEEAADCLLTAAVLEAEAREDDHKDAELSNLDERLVEVVRRLDKHERQLREVEGRS